MRIYPLPPGLIARLNIPPTYQSATAETAPPAYIAPLNRTSTFRPESIPLPPSPAPAPAPAPTEPTPPPEYSPSVYSQQRLSHHPPTSNPDPADFGFPSSPRRPSAGRSGEHPSHFKESWTDLSMRVDLEAAKRQGAGRSAFGLHAPVREGEVARRCWGREFVALGVALLAVIVGVVVVAVCVRV